MEQSKMKKGFWERHKEYMESGMTFGGALNQVQLDDICEMHDIMIDELYPSTELTNDSDVK
jgi:hypothetical protein